MSSFFISCTTAAVVLLIHIPCLLLLTATFPFVSGYISTSNEWAWARRTSICRYFFFCFISRCANQKWLQWWPARWMQLEANLVLVSFLKTEFQCVLNVQLHARAKRIPNPYMQQQWRATTAALVNNCHHKSGPVVHLGWGTKVGLAIYLQLDNAGSAHCTHTNTHASCECTPRKCTLHLGQLNKPIQYV